MKYVTKTKIKDLVQNVIEAKLNKYSAETDYKPFFEALFGMRGNHHTNFNITFFLHIIWYVCI